MQAAGFAMSEYDQSNDWNGMRELSRLDSWWGGWCTYFAMVMIIDGLRTNSVGLAMIFGVMSTVTGLVGLRAYRQARRLDRQDQVARAQ